MHRPLLLFSQPLRRMEFSLAVQPFISGDSPIHYRNHALFAFKALTGSQIISGPDQTSLRLFHFQRTAQFTTINLSPSMPQCFSHQFVIAHNRIALKEMFLCKLKGFCHTRWFVKNAASLLLGVRAEMLKRMPLVWTKPRLLLFSHLLRSDFRQLVCAGFPDKDSNFVIGWLTAMLCGESLDCGVPLRASHAVLF